MKSLLYILLGTGLSCATNPKSLDDKTGSTKMEKNIESTSAIKNAYAYSQVRIAGTIAVDENGNPLTKGVDTIYTVYLETIGNAPPDIQAIWINDKPRSVSLSPIAEKSVQVGLPTAAGKVVSINASDSNRLWHIEVGEAISPNNKTLPVTTGNEIPINQVIIEGVLNNKKFTHPVALIQLPRMEGL